MSNTYDSMAGALSSGNELGNVALVSSLIAIVVTYSEGNGVEEIRFDPRVMRMPSEDLAAEVARLVNEARADARRQMQQLVSETFGEPTAIVDQLPEFQRTVDEVLRDTHQMRDQLDVLLDRMRKMTE